MRQMYLFPCFRGKNTSAKTLFGNQPCASLQLLLVTVGPPLSLFVFEFFQMLLGFGTSSRPSLGGFKVYGRVLMQLDAPRTSHKPHDPAAGPRPDLVHGAQT